MTIMQGWSSDIGKLGSMCPIVSQLWHKWNDQLRILTSPDPLCIGFCKFSRWRHTQVQPRQGTLTYTDSWGHVSGWNYTISSSQLLVHLVTCPHDTCSHDHTWLRHKGHTLPQRHVWCWHRGCSFHFLKTENRIILDGKWSLLPNNVNCFTLTGLENSCVAAIVNVSD